MENSKSLQAEKAPRKPWARPELELLPKLSDLTLQSIPGSGGFF